MLLILKYTIFELIIQDQVLDYDRPKKCPTILYTSVAETFRHAGNVSISSPNAATAFG